MELERKSKSKFWMYFFLAIIIIVVLILILDKKKKVSQNQAELNAQIINEIRKNSSGTGAVVDSQKKQSIITEIKKEKNNIPDVTQEEQDKILNSLRGF